MQVSEKLSSITDIFQIISTQVQSSDMENYISMAASKDNFFLRTLLNGCFSKASEKIYSNSYTYFTFLIVMSC